MRDLRLDLLRGLAIYMIFLDHVSGDPLAKFTYRMIGFSDAAEIFVFVSGLACGIAYSRILVRQGAYGLTVAIVKRLVRIYISYALSSIVVILLVTAAMRYMGVQETLGLELDTPVHAIASALLMTGPPPLSNILLLYIVLTAIVVPPLVVAPDRYRNLALMASVSIWVLSQVVDTTHLIGLFFNPFAWQFLFAIGVTLGINRERKSSTGTYVLRAQWITLLAWTIVLAALLTRVLSSRSLFDVAALRFSTDEMKANLSPVRLVHFMSVAYLVAAYFHQGSSILRSRLVGPVIKMGAHSLPVFSLSIVLTFALNLYVKIHAPSLGEWMMIDCLAFLLLALTGTALAYKRWAGLFLPVRTCAAWARPRGILGLKSNGWTMAHPQKMQGEDPERANLRRQGAADRTVQASRRLVDRATD